MGKDNHLELIGIQREFFGILDEFFRRTTGVGVTDFCPISAFNAKIKKAPVPLAARMTESFSWVYDKLVGFYEKYGRDLFVAGQGIAGLKFVLGGSSRFGGTQFDSVRMMLLYADTILIPDPVFPWLETPREEEKFRDILFFETVFVLLHLKPLVDADLPYPAVFIFPSWERSLETQDAHTRARITDLINAVLCPRLGRWFRDLDELDRYVADNETDFMRVVDREHLFVAPGGTVGQPLSEAIGQYKEMVKTWRSAAYLSHAAEMTEGQIVLNGLLERFGPVYHLLENSEELASNPMLCLPAHWHYYSICAHTFEERLVSADVLDKQAVSALRALNQPELKWLGNIPIESLVTLRLNNENEEFRTRLGAHVRALHDAPLNGLGRVTTEVSQSIASLLAEHQREIERIQTEYGQKHTQTAVLGGLTAAALFVPVLAPFVGLAAPAALGAKYVFDKIAEVKAKATVARSLTGILAVAEAQTD